MERDPDWVVQDSDVNVALGAEMRAAREAAGLTRPELVAQLPFKTTVPSVLNWELGHRAASYARLIEWGRALNRPAPDLLRGAIERVDSIPSLLVEIDLVQLCKDTTPALATLRTWAQNKLAVGAAGEPLARIHHSVIREWAVQLGVSLPQMVSYLKFAASLRQVGMGV